ncbi:hypothetical protein ABPG73_015191 [Tetrahymena malaccensis]
MLDPQPNYYVRSFLNIPQTNILIVNTISDIVQGSSIVYYIDMETSGGSVINVVKHSCLNPSIGDLFTSETYQFLILACDDFSIISYDLKAGNKNQITQLTQIPFVLQIFNNKNLIGIGDKSKGTAVFFKFNAPSFGFLIEINPGKNKDTILQIDILVDGTLWLQFINSNLFIPFSQCISDHNNCLICQQNFYFKIQNGYDQKQTYGQGIINQEYRTSQSFVTAMIRAQIYQEVVQATQAMTVNISIDQSNPFSLSTVLLNFDFSNIISLMMQCTQCQNGQYFTLKFPDSMVFRNYLQIQLNQVSIDFTELSADDDCGITLQNIQNNSTINDIQIISQKNAKQNCNQIQINNATVTISNYTISGQDFSNTSSIITTINTGQINLISLSLVNSILGRSFSVLSQLSDVTANLNQISISNNTCAQNVADDTIVSSLFSASLFAVQNFNISYNYLCNTLIFTTVASIEQHNQIFRFDNVTLLGNQLVTKTTYILFNALYSMLSKPDHQVIFTNLSITYNKLVVANSLTDQQISSFISTSKVSNVSLINTNFVNQHHIFLSIIDTSNNVQIVNANCINEQSYNLNQTVLARTAGCLYFTEVQQLNISTINIINKNTIDENLIKFESFITKSIQITIDNANLTGIAQTQLAGNAPMNPIYIMVMYDLQASITNSVFTQNTYTIDETKSDKFIISTNGLGAHFLTGNINIQNCTFFNSSSNSGYNYIYIVGDVVNMNQVNFTQSSYSDLALNQPYLFKNRGGNLYIQINYLNITNCLFSQSTSMLGSFIYAMPISSLLQIHIQDTTFNEGYANIDGGAIYLYPSNTIHFNCKNCDFIDIYTMNIADTSAIIGLENSATLDTSHHVFNFDGGIIKNIFGNGDNTFLSLQSVDIIIQNYQTITTVSTNSLYSIFAKMLNTQNVGVQPAQITNAAQQSLLISASQSIVNITNCKFSQSIFKFQAISIVQGNLSLNQVTFYNISQYQNKRSLQQLVVQNPIAKGNSLILLQNSQLQITNLSLFQNINCTLNCNGGSIQLLNSQFSISDTTFNYSNVNILFQFSNIKASFSQADFGGAIFIQGIVNENSIQNASFLSNQANFDGGAIFFNSMLTDKFSLTIDKSTFSENLSINSRGGALYILSNAYNSVVQSFAIQNTIIQSNKAMVGGAINSQNISPKSINNQFIGNQALIYGNNQISYPTQLDYYNITQFLQDNQNATFKEGLLTISNFRSGENLPTIYLQFKNEEAVLYPITNSDFQQYVIDVNVFQAQQNPDYDVSGNISSIYDKNTKSFILTEIKIVGTPNSSQYYEFKSNIIKVLDPNTQQYSSDYSLRFLIQFRECIAGEEVQKYNQLLECSPCSQNMYSLDSKGCKQCPDGANCLGGTNITVKNDYWRRSYESDLIIQCENQLSNCIGGSYGNLLCFQGHIGALCEECDIYGEYWDSKYAKSGKYSCTNCNQITGNLYIVILMTAWTMFSMTIAIKSDIDTLEYEAGALKIKKITRKKGQNNSIIRPTNVTLSKQKKFGNSQEDGAKAGIYIKMLTNYLQIVNSLTTFHLSLPSGIFVVPDSVGRPLQQTVNSIDCALAEISTNVPIIYLRVIVSISLPIFYFLLFFIGVVIKKVLNRLDEYSTFSSAASILIGVFIYSNPYSYFVIIGFVLLIIINVWYIAYLLIKILSGYIFKIKGMKKMVMQKLSKKFSYFKKYIPKDEEIRKMDPKIRQKMRDILNKFLNYSPEEKREFILKLYQNELTATNKPEYDKIKQNFIQKINIYIFQQKRKSRIQAQKKTTIILKKQQEIKAINLEENNQGLIIFDSENPQPSYYFRSFLNIPKTNILIANTISDSIQGSSIVYYLDMETSSGSILNVVKPDYLIIQMDYILSQDEIVIANDNKILVVNPYTLKARKSVIFKQVVSFLLVPSRNYIVVTLAQNQLIVIDTQNLLTQSILDNSDYIQLGNTNQYQTQLITLQQNQDVLICSDSIGLFSWIADFNQLTFTYNGYIDDKGCLNPSIGDLFVSSQYQFLILSCDDLTVISYDLKSGFKKIIKQLTQVPFVLSLFNNKQVIGIGNKAKGTALLYKFNAPNFDFLIEVNPGKNQDVILAIDFLIDGTLWLQFSNSNLFIPFNQCISDPKNCLICQQNFYFKIQNGYDQSQTYGKGLIGFEYRTSQSFVTAMIKITLISFSLFQSVLGRNFSVISQLSNVIINLDQINISENVCAQNVPDDSVVSSLFSASLFSVSNFNITNNNFCNSLIFTTVASIQQHNQIFQFNNLTIYGNQFVTKTTYILFNALYSMLSKPDHQVMFTNLNINDNKLIVSNAQTDQKISSFISTSKVLNVTFTNINFVNQNHIFLSIIDNSDNVQIVNTNCTNEQSFNDNNNQQDLTRTAGCLYFTEVSSLNISTINIINKNTVDENLIKFESFFTQSSKILIDKANISGINQTQKAGNAPMNPIYLMVMYDLQFSITNSVFKHNTYTINENTQDKTIISTTGIGARFLTGALNIQKCTFFNSSSNSQFNNIYILGDTANLNEVNFISSSYSEQILNQPFFFKNHGGNLYLQINYINLTNCHFSQSTSQLGSFIYAMPISAPLQIYIQDSIFSEGYASIDGGAIYLYPSNTINFNCKNCSFIDIYTMNSNSAATLGFENSVTQDTSRHNINFNGGIIKNLFGNGDNTFMTLQTADITIQNYQKITIESINPHYLDLLKKIYTSDGQLVQPAQLVNIQSCTLKVSNCNVINWNQINASQQPLIINSQQSQVNLSNCNFTNIIFKKQALSIIQGNLSLNHILFNDISQIQNKRSLQQLIVQTPVADGSSLIQLQNSNIQITNFTLFQNINCIENCNGGTLQLQNSQFTISDTTFKNSYADFGGAIFIEGIPQVNKINNCNFIQNNANYDGGAIYFNSDLKDIYGDFWDSKYAKSGKYSCTNCNQITGNLYVVILLTAWTMLSMTIAIKADIETLENEAGALKIKQNLRKKGKNNSIIRPANVTLSKKKKFGNSWEDDDKAGVYIKMLTNYLQIVNSLTTFNLRLPPSIFIVPDSVGRPLQQTLNSMDCALAQTKTNIPIIYLRVVVSIAIPVFYFLLFSFGVIISRISATNHPEYDKIKTNFIQKMDFYQFKQDSKTHLQAKNTKIVFNLQSEGNNNQQTEGVENNEELIIFDSESSQLSEEKSVKVEEQVSDQQQSNSKRFFQHNSKPSKTQDNSFSNSDKKTKDLESQKPSQVNQPEQTIFCQFEAENQN